MTRGAWMCSRQYDDGLKIWFAPRENEKPFTDSERAQKWRLSLASLLFFTVLLSDHLWFCAEAKLTRTRDKEQQQHPERELLSSMGEPSPAAQAAHRLLSSSLPTLSASGQCFSVEDADSVCRRRWSREQQVTGNHPTPGWNLTDFYLSFCNSYTLWELFAGLSNPDTLNCSLDVVLEGEGSCSQCVQAYQRYDQHAQEKYEEFEVMLQKYLQSDEYSVKSCPEDCKVGALLCVMLSFIDGPAGCFPFFFFFRECVNAIICKKEDVPGDHLCVRVCLSEVSQGLEWL
uniref:NALCN channel auxiliary factor 1 n=1 Tax=Terrapene triunguis TaxID=2587831 RepID=A0A674HWK9_9SAUR